MRKMMFVGCGGTGGAVLRHMMDQLTAEFRAAGLPGIPRVWAFANVDVPVTEDLTFPVPTIADLGGTYISCAPPNPTYAVAETQLLHSVSSATNTGGEGGLGLFTGWLPEKATDVSTPLSLGAGQLRAVGRVATLNALGGIQQRLLSVWQSMATGDGAAHAASAALPGLGAYNPNTPPFIVVVSSMAGGAGASMVLDVCRVLKEFPGATADTTAVFMASAEAFTSLPMDAKGGILPNALAMFGEIVAAQSQAATAHDTAMAHRLGLTATAAGLPFGRVFPIGNKVGYGANRPTFGDGTRLTIYRGVARALSALAMSEAALHNFLAYDVTNSTPLAQDQEIFGWGAQAAEHLQWGSWGFASLSMGRDRYLEYSAQRLARATVDEVVDGHRRGMPVDMVATNAATARVNTRWEDVCRRLGIPHERGAAARQDFAQWAGSQFSNGAAAQAIAQSAVDPALPMPAQSVPAAQFVAAIHGKVSEVGPGVRRQVEVTAYALAYGWVSSFVAKVETVVAEEVAVGGAAYARALVERLNSHIENWVVPGLRAVGGAAPPDAGDLPAETKQTLSGLRNVLAQTQDLVEQVKQGFRKQIGRNLTGQAQRLAGEALLGFGVGVGQPLTRALSDVLHNLEHARSAALVLPGLAVMETDCYAAWPADDEETVHWRWSTSVNEVLLTPPSTFRALFPNHLSAAVGVDRRESAKATLAATRAVISGRWSTTGAEPAPGTPLRRAQEWVPAPMINHPGSDQPQVPQAAAYTLDLSAQTILARSRAYISRVGEPFATFASVSLRTYATEQLNDAMRTARELEVTNAFGQVLALAQPLVSVGPDDVQAVHQTAPAVRFSLGAIPFQGLPSLERGVLDHLHDFPGVDPDFLTRLSLTSPFTQDGGLRAIDVFGAYPCYAPLAFSGVFSEIARDWAVRSLPQAREHFWRLRRARPLPAALPMTEAERQAMVGGWFVGRVTGAIKIPVAPYLEPVQIFDRETSRWVAFPSPMLTPQPKFRNADDWLPAVLESILLAMAQFSATQGQSLRPYRVLRRLWDEGQTGPTNTDNGMIQLAGQRIITEWALGRFRPTGGAPVGAHQEGEGPRARAIAGRDWVEQLRAFLVSHYLPADPQSGRAQSDTSPRTRAQLIATPYFRDLAPDVEKAAIRLMGWLSADWPEDHEDRSAPPAQPGMAGGFGA